MKVIIDTPIWSFTFWKKRYDENNVIIDNLINLIRNARIKIIGSIRQEVLSGISDKNKFYEVKNRMAIFTDYVVQTSDYEFVAECSNEEPQGKPCGIEDFSLKSSCMRGNTSPAPPAIKRPKGRGIKPLNGYALNEYRRNGIQGSHTDFLICAVTIKNNWEIFTEDKDFFEYEKHLPIKI
jgi:hypothetical protein